MVILFSRSGSTTYKLLCTTSLASSEKELWILSNNFNQSTISPALKERYLIDYKTHREIEDMLRDKKPTKVLLMGYLRILSPDICNRHEIYNIHPADIVNHPELKGKDPVERIFEEDPLGEKYKRLGIVLHRVVSEVDSGEILYFESFSRTNMKEAYKTLDEIALNFWKKLLRER